MIIITGTFLISQNFIIKVAMVCDFYTQHLYFTYIIIKIFSHYYKIFVSQEKETK